ncbi:Mur ligase family protein [Microbacterium enclense]|uniref:Mur ligase family protein n=1 Tax=Microbacterium enclense TaxID=993073 RepID=UPI001428D23B|nr:cyanophycin synthetase [Microbacterium enclense]
MTGTNGKTSVATATFQLMNSIGWPAASYNSTGITGVDGVLHKANTRRSPDYLPDLIEYQRRRGAVAVSLEAYVGILADGLFERVDVDAAVSTGFERDHLDVHKSIDAYWAAKLRLFEEYLRPDGVGVLTTKSAQANLVRAAIGRRGARLLEVGEGGEIDFTPDSESDGKLRGRLEIDGRAYEAVLPTVHAVAATNLLLAGAAVVGLGGEPQAVVDALALVTPPPGRLQVIAERDGVIGIVDTAHNPGALRAALRSVRPRVGGRLLLVFGAGGGRDVGKRFEMGEIASDLADIVIITDDNPRHESPERIRGDVRAGSPRSIEIPRRKDAILAAIFMARPGDVVLVAGMGDEEYQHVGGERIPHDDREIIREAMSI